MDISIDFETRSATDLLNEGMYNYFADESTDIICMAYSINGAEPEVWVPGDKPPRVFFASGIRIHAWNADFERLAWEYIMVPDYGFPPVALEQWRCTAFKSRCNNLPNKLENAARCLRVPQQKEARGRELIKLLCLPLADGTFCRDPGLLQEMYDYCAQDVRTEQAVDAMLREPTAQEWQDYFVNSRINDKGVKVDVDLCVAAQAYAREEEEELLARIEAVTDGAVTKARGEGLKAWVVERLPEHQAQVLVTYRDGERKLSMAKWNRARLLDLEDLDPDVREVVECSDIAQKSSVGKFRAMARMADLEDDRVRGAMMCNGASQSGRYSSKGMQIHNFPRDCMADPVAVRQDFIDDILPEDIVGYWKLPMMTVLSRMLRAAIIPRPGNVFLDSDWSAIEGRFAPWLAKAPAGEEKLDLYRNDVDVYVKTAAATFHVPEAEVNGEQRQVGKVQELSFQYGGGDKAFLAFARNYGVKATASQAKRYKDAWRANNPWAPWIWQTIERAVVKAIRAPGEMFPAGRVRYFTVQDILCGGLTLFCELPCGRVLTYPDVRMRRVDGPYGAETEISCMRAAWQPKATEKEWPRMKLWGGLLFENIVQGAAASLLRWALWLADQQGLNVVFHVHDQIVAEVSERKADECRKVLEEIMNSAPAWAEGLPVKAEVEVKGRFGK